MIYYRELMCIKYVIIEYRNIHNFAVMVCCEGNGFYLLNMQVDGKCISN